MVGNAYRVTVAVVLGLVGFLLSLFPVVVDVPPHAALFVPALAVPMAVALAWGWRYGLLSATVGLGCQGGWFTGDGWAAAVSVVLATAWMVWHGYCAEWRRRGAAWLWPYLAEIPFRIIGAGVVFSLYQWVYRFNPAPWDGSPAPMSIGGEALAVLAVFSAIDAYVVLLLADVLLNMGVVRKLLGLEAAAAQGSTDAIIAASAAFGVAFWIVDGVLDYVTFYEGKGSLADLVLFDIPPHELYIRIAFLLLCLSGGLLFSRLVRVRRQGGERFRAITENASDIAVVIGWDRSFSYVSPSVTSGFENVAGDMLGQPLGAFVHPDDLPMVEARYRLLFDGMVTGFALHEMIHDEDGEPCDCRFLEINPAFETLTGLRAAEVIGKRMLEELPGTEPLRAIDGFSLAPVEDHESSLDAGAREYLHFLRDGAGEMGRLIDDLLGLLRVARGQLERRDMDLSKLVREVAAQLLAADPGHRVTFDIAPDVVVNADPRLLRVALENILGNAWKFTANQANARIEFGATGEKERAIFFVRDNGAGFNMEYADKMFQPFQRLHRTDEFEGSGIGLSTVQRIIRRHGGCVWAEGVEGEGATIFCEL